MHEDRTQTKHRPSCGEMVKQSQQSDTSNALRMCCKCPWMTSPTSYQVDWATWKTGKKLRMDSLPRCFLYAMTWDFSKTEKTGLLKAMLLQFFWCYRCPSLTLINSHRVPRHIVASLHHIKKMALPPGKC